MKFHRLLTVPLIVTGLLAGACSSPSDNESNIAPFPATDVNPHDRGSLVPGGELRLAVSELGSLNPMSSDQKGGLDQFNRAIFPTFFDYTDNGIPQPNPDFVESVQEVSTKPTVVTMRLNPNATWADGAPITASDVIATWRACNGMTQGFRCRSELQFAQISEVTQGASPQDVTFNFRNAFPGWQHTFDQVSVLREESVRDPDTFNSRWQAPKRGWSTGPYALDRTGPNFVTATPNTGWWGERPLLERISVRAIPAADQPQAFADSQLDALSLPPDKAAYDIAMHHPDQALRRAGALNWRQLVFNPLSSAPVTEPEVRQAIAMALDRSGVGMAAYAGLGANTNAMNNHVFVPQQSGYADNAKVAERDNNLRRAKSALDRAGWKEGQDKVREKGGRRLTVRYAALTGVPDATAEAEAAKRQLAKVGVDLQVDGVPLSEADAGTVLSSGDFEIIAVNVDGSRFPTRVVADNYASDADRNFARFASPQIDTKIEAMRNEPDKDRRNQLANEIDLELWTNLTTVPLYQNPQVTIVRTRLANFGSFGLATPRWENVGYVS